MKKQTEPKRILIETVKELLKTNYEITVKDITEKAFMNVSSVNYHFGDKDKLVEIAALEILTEFKREITDYALKEFPSTKDAVEGFLIVLNNFVSNNKGLVRQLIAAGSSENVISFFSIFTHDPQFMPVILGKIMQLNQNVTTEQAFARFIILFSSIAMPVLFPSEKEENTDFFSDAFGQVYIGELIKVLD